MFIEFGLKHFIDIFLVATLLYSIFRIMRESRSLNVFAGIMVFVWVWLFVSRILDMRLLGAIMDKLASVGVLALIIVFQEELRKFLYSLGAHNRFNLLFKYFSASKKKEKEEGKSPVMPVVLACINMAKERTGALVVIERGTPLDDIMTTGDRINANITQRLIENIFFKNSPLHDGALIISKKRIMAAACILPVSHDLDIPKSLGLRHRAAMGISQTSDAMAIVVSEETGNISVAIKGEFHLRLSPEELERLLAKEVTL